MATFSPFSRWCSHACALALILGSTQSVGAQTSIAIDAKQTYQSMYGFGATTISLAFGATDNVPANLRAQAIQALYRDVHLNTGSLAIEPSEAPAANVFAPANDNDDPAVINPAGFNWIQSTNMHDLVVVPGSQYGFDAYFLGPAVSTIYALSWADAVARNRHPPKRRRTFARQAWPRPPASSSPHPVRSARAALRPPQRRVARSRLTLRSFC